MILIFVNDNNPSCEMLKHVFFFYFQFSKKLRNNKIKKQYK